MKKIINLILIIGLVTMSVSCEDTDKLNFNPLELPSGAFLRTLSIDSNQFDRENVADSSFGVTVEGDDGQNGETMTSIDLYVTFRDRTPDNGTVVKDEAFVKNIPISSFSRGASGLLGGQVNASASETLSALGLAGSDIDGGDTFTFRLALNLSDGRTFSTTEIGPDVTGAFFNSPFRYVVAIVCIPPTPVTGNYEFQMVDTYGDGWDGAFVTATIDGVATDYTATGTGTTHTINVPDGTTSLSFVYTPGSFEGEHVLTVIGPVSGNEIYNANPPPAGELILNLCKEF